LSPNQRTIHLTGKKGRRGQPSNLGNSNPKRLASQPGKGLGARGVFLSLGLLKDGITELGEEAESLIVASETLSGGAEESEAGDELESVGAAAHQFFERSTARQLVVHGAGDFFVAGAEERVAQVVAGFRQIADRISAGSGRTAEAFDLREDVPDPVTRFAPPTNLGERRVVAGCGTGLGFVEEG
jgi:hypothetical protein